MPEARSNETKTSLDYRRLSYDVLTIGESVKSIYPVNKSAYNNDIEYFVQDEELFDILKTAHTETGYGRLHKMHNALEIKYENICLFQFQKLTEIKEFLKILLVKFAN